MQTSCKSESENRVWDKRETFKVRRIRAKIPCMLGFRASKPPIFWKGIKKLASEPSTFYTSFLSTLSFHVSAACPFLIAVISSCSYLCNGKPLWCRFRCRSLSPTEASMCCGKDGRKKKRERGARWEREREKRDLRLPPFPSSHHPSHAFYFFRLLLFL